MCHKANRWESAIVDNKKIETTITELLRERGAKKTVCPSEVARRMAGDTEWRELMEPVRCVARELAGGGIIEFTQGGEVVDPDQFKGPVRLRQSKTFPE